MELYQRKVEHETLAHKRLENRKWKYRRLEN